MSGYFQYVQIFRTNIIDDETLPIKEIFDDTKIEIIGTHRRYEIPVPMGKAHLDVQSLLKLKSQTLDLDPKYKHIIISVRHKQPSFEIEFISRQKITEISAIFSLISNVVLFADKVYEGWLVNDGVIVSGTWTTFPEPLKFTGEQFKIKLNNVMQFLSANQVNSQRFNLMSSFFYKSLQLPPSDEKLILQWTTLEVFPMESSKRIKKVISHLSGYTKIDKYIINEKLKLKRLYGLRSKLIHSGISVMDNNESIKVLPGMSTSEIFALLESIVIINMRSICGLRYKGGFNRWLNPKIFKDSISILRK